LYLHLSWFASEWPMSMVTPSGMYRLIFALNSFDMSRQTNPWTRVDHFFLFSFCFASLNFDSPPFSLFIPGGGKVCFSPTLFFLSAFFVASLPVLLAFSRFLIGSLDILLIRPLCA
ncbi:hypothetical protein PFISCL1PPCAC_4590, partial [Pristionchus fissidentatus]